MALDQVNTQVLLLHSEQGTLDNLSAVIDERYTVHCASSGSEALQTLGETPIHVIISAQHLPGMSGVEALREAKKRSPETVGILLAAGANDDSVGALAGEQEFFRVIRGGIAEKDLNKLLSEATQQMRLLALAESANDGDANPGESVAEHIVMEAAENGSATISDGTGTWSTLPLDAEPVDGAADAVDVLVLSKDSEFLTTVQDSSRATHVVRAVSTLAQAEQALEQHDVGVAVVDAGMVGDRVEKLTEHLQRKKERLVCIVAGRRDDGEMLMDLINRGKVYRFLLKPVSPGRARLAVEASVKHHLEAPDSAFGPGHADPTPIRRGKARGQSGDEPSAEVVSAPDQTPVRKSAAAPDDGSQAAPAAESAAGRLAQSGVRERPDLAETIVQGRTEGGDGHAGFGDTVVQTVSLRPRAADDPASDSERTDRRRRPAKLAAMGLVAGIAAILAAGFFVLGSDDVPLPAGTVQPTPADEVTALAPPPVEPDPELVAAEFIAAAETAMLERRLAAAEAALDDLRSFDPEHARLPFLTTQLARMQLRDNIYEARAAIGESRFADAADALAEARALDSADTAVIDALSAELSDALGRRQTEDWLSRAAASADAGRLISPRGNNARHYFELVLGNEPDNAAARQGLKTIAGKLVLQAMQAVDQYRFDEAEKLLGEAQRLDPASGDIAASAEALADARERLIEEQRSDEDARRAETRAEAQRLAALQEQNAEPAAAIGADSNRSDGGAMSNGIAERPASAAFVEAQPLQSAPDPALKSPVAVSSLTRTRYVAPKYPRNAERRNQSGWVDVVFTVGVDGSTRDIEIKESEPGDVFVGAAVRAVEKWEFEPVLENGVAIERRAKIRMMFAIE